jgi:hypothetical protein
MLTNRPEIFFIVFLYLSYTDQIESTRFRYLQHDLGTGRTAAVLNVRNIGQN